MALVRWVLFLSYILTTLSGCLTNAQPLFTAVYCYYPSIDTYTNDSTFKKNLDALASIVFSSTVSFHNLSIGQNPDRVNVIALCRGDVDRDMCRSCLKDAYTKLREICPNYKQPIGWYDDCMLRYSDRDIFNTMFILPNANTSNSATVSTGITRQFNQAVTTLLSELLGKASRGTSDKKFATGNITIGPDNNRTTIYALAECTPDLSEQECRDCLNGTHEVFPQCCEGRIGARFLYPSCNFRYEIGQFYSTTTSDGGPPTTTPPTVQGNGNGEKNTTRNLIFIVISTIIFLVVVIACIWIITRKRMQRMNYLLNENEGEISMGISSVTPLQFEFEIIKDATDDFSDTNKLGQGGFGAVYKGRLPNGRGDVAVKRLSQTSKQGEKEFKNEVSLMAKLQHRNLVKLLGFCLEGTERLLIYEFIANASLDQFIFDSKKRGDLNRSRRYKIIEGIARGLMYLHVDYSSDRIIHRDLKASNILLDADMNPKIADFGMARMFGSEETHVTTEKLAGTYGYMAPEYAIFRQFSVKSDVFSFGVLVLEIISGHKNSHSFGDEDNGEHLLSYAWKNWKEGTHSNFIDPTLLDGSSSMSEILRCIHIGLLCVQENAVDRPTMASVVIMLSSMSGTLKLPSKPAFLSIDQQRSQVYSVNEASITELSGR